MPVSSNSRIYMVLLYPEDPLFQTYLEAVENGCASRAWLLHNKDIDDNGKIKKAHLHIVCYFENALSINGCFRKFGGIVPQNYIERQQYIKRAVRYLVHKDNPEKFQYPIEDVQSTFDVSAYFKDKSNEASEAIKIVEDINEGRVRTVYDLVSRGYEWSIIRRNYSIFRDLIYQSDINERYRSLKGLSCK